MSHRNSIIQYVFFGNYFYGLCLVALSIEATLQQRFPLNDLFYYCVAFACTVMYYTRAYSGSNNPASKNPRVRWYSKHRSMVRTTQVVLALFVISSLCIFAFNHLFTLLSMGLKEWFLLLVFPLAGSLYYGNKRYNLRHIGWLKPFIIGFAWAGMANIYPVLYFDIVHELPYELTTVGLLLFLKNLMFVTVLCIMFDIKDYASDSRRGLNTFIVKKGLRKTIYFIIAPLCLAGLGSFVFYGLMHGFHPVKILLNVLPFALLMAVAYTLQKRRSVLYYLIVVDGLMLFKAICGSIAMIWF